MSDGAHSHGVKAIVGAGALVALAALGAAVAAAVLAARFLADVFSVEGFAYTVGIGSGAHLMWPLGVRIVTLLLALEVGAFASAVLDWREADIPIVTYRHAWAYGHFTMLRRVRHRVAWWRSVLMTLWLHTRRPGSTVPPSPADKPRELAPVFVADPTGVVVPMHRERTAA